MTLQVASNPQETNGSAANGKTPDLNVFLNQRLPFPPTLNGATSACLQELRHRATAEIAALTLPSSRDEEWRFTKLTPLLELDWSSTVSNVPTVSAEQVSAYRLPDVETCLVFVNGVYRTDLSNVSTVLGVTVGALSDEELFGAIAPTLDQYLAQQQGLEQTFTTLNTASFVDGAVIWVDAKTVASSPIHILSISTAPQTAPVINHPRCLVVAEPNSQVTLIEDYVAVGEAPYLTNPVTEIFVGDNAQVSHVRVQRDGTAAFHIGKTAVSQAPDSRYHCHAISLGGRISRHNLEIFQTGPQTETVLNGLSMIGGNQLADTHSLIAYEHPHSMSRQLHKCIVDDRAHAVFNGKVNVPQAAQLTDAGQLNRNLLLSPNGRVDTKPQLEIVADNVKCTHGATVSQLKADEVFYLQSRGIDSARAQNLLIYAFAAEILEALPIESLKVRLSEAVDRFTQ